MSIHVIVQIRTASPSAEYHEPFHNDADEESPCTQALASPLSSARRYVNLAMLGSSLV